MCSLVVADQHEHLHTLLHLCRKLKARRLQIIQAQRAGPESWGGLVVFLIQSLTESQLHVVPLPNERGLGSHCEVGFCNNPFLIHATILLICKIRAIQFNRIDYILQASRFM